MNGINRKLRGVAIAVLAATTLLSQAWAAPVVSINPTSQTINVGGPASIDIVVSGLTLPGEAVGGFSLLLAFNSVLLSGVNFTLDPGARMGAFDPQNDFSFGFTGGSLDLFYLANADQDQAGLAGLQAGGSFTLATVEFSGLANGVSPLQLSDVVLSFANGDTTLPQSGIRNGEICVGGNCGNDVPEPSTILLVGAALGALALRRRRPI